MKLEEPAKQQNVAEKELRRLQHFGMKKVKELGLKEEDVQRLIDEYRSEA
ncbi:MAG: hypothetical protein WC600_13275 [Desulfobaccales bacterium]|jgi:hypothetical protein